MKRHLIFLFCSVICVALWTVAQPSEAKNASMQSSDPEIVFWETVQEANDIDMYRAYIKQYPKGHFVELAQFKIETLSKKDLDGVKPADKLADKPIAPHTIVQLRHWPERVSPRELKDLINEYNFSIPERNPNGDFKNAFADNMDGTVTDETTGLIWQEGHSYYRLNHFNAQRYIEKLNAEQYAGCTSWRIPTIEELASLMEKTPQPPQWLYMDPIFQDPNSNSNSNSNIPDRFWSSDRDDAKGPLYRHAWIVDFRRGKMDEAFWRLDFGSARNHNEKNHLKAVCSK